MNCRENDKGYIFLYHLRYFEGDSSLGNAASLFIYRRDDTTSTYDNSVHIDFCTFVDSVADMKVQMNTIINWFITKRKNNCK